MTTSTGATGGLPVPVFGFDAMPDWEGAESGFLFWCCGALLGLMLLYVAANVLLLHVTRPRGRSMR